MAPTPEPTCVLYVRVPASLHAQVMLLARERQQSVQGLVRELLNRELHGELHGELAQAQEERT